MDSTAIVNVLKQYMSEGVAIMIFGVLGIVVPFVWRALASWAANRPTTWYWNPVTKKFVLGMVSAALGRIFGRGVNDCNVKYQDGLPPEAIEALRKRIEQTYPAPVITRVADKSDPMM